MSRAIKSICATLVITFTVSSAFAFSLVGPFTEYQTTEIGYDVDDDFGGPMNLGEGYRWNIKTITWGFDDDFLLYFGNPGSNALYEAMEILNGLRPFSKMSATLSEFPTDTMRINHVAAALGLMDLKSATLGLMMGQLGLTAPERYVWALRSRQDVDGTVQYLVIMRNFDPVRRVPTPYVNDVLYTYAIIDPIPFQGGSFADAVEIPVDPDALRPFSSVASFDDLMRGENPVFGVGNYWTGLTRDDFGGLRYLYEKGKLNSRMESLVPGVTNSIGGGSGSPWGPISGSNAVVDVALRTGVDKIQFQFMKSTFGVFTPRTNSFVDMYYTNNFRQVKQRVERVLEVPDILFSAADLGLSDGGLPILYARTTAASGSNFVNNASLNSPLGTGSTDGPGQINPSVVITFSKLGPSLVNQDSAFLDQANASPNVAWGSFGGGTNIIIYPVGTTIQDRELLLFRNQF